MNTGSAGRPEAEAGFLLQRPDISGCVANPATRSGDNEPVQETPE